ncbi:MAG: MATE family efflux transporter [Oscillospiraceae bacterium]|nr:MATE family efflux transporter [Oscillospiraceae bacterium]
MKNQATAIREKRSMDMLHGSIIDKILFFALPLAASSMLQQFFNSADVAVVAHFAGSGAQAAVGVNGSVISLLINLFVGISVGANVVIANYIGQERRSEVSEVVHTVVSVALISGFLLLGLGQILAPPMLRLMNTPAEILNMAVLYLRIYFLGMPFLMIYNFGAAILRSVGDTIKPLICLTISGVLNVCLNMISVIFFHLGVVGVGVATVLANGVSAAVILRFLTHGDEMIRVDLKRLTLNRRHLTRVVRIGVPAGVQGMVFSLSNICIQTAINSFDTFAIAGSAAAVNFEFFTYFITSAFSQSVVTFTSQNFGAGQLSRCKKIYWSGMGLGFAFTGLMCICFVLARDWLILFYAVEPEVIYYGLIRMLHVELFCFLPVIYEVSGAALRGMGYSTLPAVLTVIGSCGLRFVWVYTIFARYNSFEMLMNVYPVTWLVTGVFVMLAYFVVRGRVFAAHNQ